ncbi:hypothetical protein B4Q13_25225, partial [Lacticaseibacillus rhamnosus]
MWDASTGQEGRTLQGHTQPVLSVCFSPDGKRVLSGSYDGTLKVWDADTGKRVLTLQGHTSWVTSGCFSPDGKRIQWTAFVIAGTVDADTYWERITYFLERVVPVAEEYKVRMGCHPQDPGLPKGYRGIDAVLATPEGLKRFVSIKESPYHGLNFCQGTVSEQLENP